MRDGSFRQATPPGTTSRGAPRGAPSESFASRAALRSGRIVVALHGLVHLLGTVAYLRLAEIPELPYKTTLLGGRVEVGDLGMTSFGLAWGVVGVAFVALAVASWVGRRGTRAWLAVVATASLVLTLVDLEVAVVGAVVDVVILLALAAGPTVLRRFGAHGRAST